MRLADFMERHILNAILLTSRLIACVRSSLTPGRMSTPSSLDFVNGEMGRSRTSPTTPNPCLMSEQPAPRGALHCGRVRAEYCNRRSHESC
jgi:hypothetical protein